MTNTIYLIYLIITFCCSNILLFTVYKNYISEMDKINDKESEVTINKD